MDQGFSCDRGWLWENRGGGLVNGEGCVSKDTVKFSVRSCSFMTRSSCEACFLVNFAEMSFMNFSIWWDELGEYSLGAYGRRYGGFS